MRLYDSNRPPSEMTDDQIAHTIEEVDRELEAAKLLKPGTWRAEFTSHNMNWMDDPRGCTVAVKFFPHGRTEGAHVIASGTIFDTQREVMFMAAMREDYPETLRVYRNALTSIQALRKQIADLKKRKRS